MNIMLDLETMGTRPDAAIVAIGAVTFNPADGLLGETFYRTVDLGSAIRAGGVIDGETVAWWLTQSEEARAALLVNPQPIHLVLADFSLWCRRQAAEADLLVWGNGATFDNVVVSTAYERIGLRRPWGTFADRCYRTVKAQRRDIKMARSGTHHNALDDAISQAVHLCEIFRALQTPALKEA